MIREKDLSEPAQTAFRRRIEDEECFLSTCDGGDPGTPDQRSIWVLGIEPGWSLNDENVEDDANPEHASRLQAYPVELQLEWPFNRNAFKLLSALDGGEPENYRDFAMKKRPFERGSKGYFKANLFPEPCNKVGEWDATSIAKTGFSTKDEYRSWIRENRFRVLKTWIARCSPRVVIGTSITHVADFLAITGSLEMPPVHTFEVSGHLKRMYLAKSGTVPLAVVPHLSGGSHSLNSNAAIKIAAAHIRAEIDL